MKKLIFLTLLFVCTLAGAQTRFSCCFTMIDESGSKVSEGTACVQHDCYRIETPSMQVWCNGKDRWIYSPKSDELVIQPDDVSFLKDIQVSRSSGGKATVKWQGFVIELTDIKEVTEAWPAVFFIIDPELFGDDTIITDLR